MDAVDPCDVLADLAVDSIPDSAVSDADVCVTVAGVIDTFAPAHLMSAQQWSRDIDVNLTGAFRVVQACLPGMRDRGFGRIVAISSMAGRMGNADKVAHASCHLSPVASVNGGHRSTLHRGSSVSADDREGVQLQPTGDADLLSGDIAGVITGQKGDHVRDFVRGTAGV
jgi:NAD(P)-dependent dehydrogenase (short-subunit alcohol dehydrogenase family)